MNTRKLNRNLIPIIVGMIFVFSFVSCKTVSINPARLTPQQTYHQAVNAFDSLWSSYHKVWLAQDEKTKMAWVETYHEKFLHASDFLKAWGKDIQNPAMSHKWDVLLDELENILVEIAVKKSR